MAIFDFFANFGEDVGVVGGSRITGLDADFAGYSPV